jgi:hypothetical protein
MTLPHQPTALYLIGKGHKEKDRPLPFKDVSRKLSTLFYLIYH